MAGSCTSELTVDEVDTLSMVHVEHVDQPDAAMDNDETQTCVETLGTFPEGKP